MKYIKKIFLLDLILFLAVVIFIIWLFWPDRNCDDFSALKKIDKEHIFTSRAKLQEIRAAQGAVLWADFYRNGRIVHESVSYPCTWIDIFRRKINNCSGKVENSGTFVLYSDVSNEVIPIYTKKQLKQFSFYFPDSAKLIDTSILCDE